jgi:hypothetical protein
LLQKLYLHSTAKSNSSNGATLMEPQDMLESLPPPAVLLDTMLQ